MFKPHTSPTESRVRYRAYRGDKALAIFTNASREVNAFLSVRQWAKSLTISYSAGYASNGRISTSNNELIL